MRSTWQPEINCLERLLGHLKDFHSNNYFTEGTKIIILCSF
jgi:hypothetical protein